MGIYRVNVTIESGGFPMSWFGGIFVVLGTEFNCWQIALAYGERIYYRYKWSDDPWTNWKCIQGE